MQLEWLHTFLVAAEEENFHRAADRLHLAQPTVTLHIQKLEQLWGLALFQRLGRHVVLTAGGRRMVPAARAMLQAYEDSRDTALRWQQGYEATLAIAVSPLVATTYLPRWLQVYQAAHPTVECTIRVTESSEILDHILDRTADVGFTRLPVVHPQVSVVPLYDDPVILVAPADATDLDAPAPDAAEFMSSHPVFVGNHPVYWADLLEALRGRFPRVRTMPVSQVHVTVQFIVERMGVSFLPESTVGRELLRGNVREVAWPWFALPTARTLALCHSGVSPAGQQFLDLVRQYMAFRPIRMD